MQRIHSVIYPPLMPSVASSEQSLRDSCSFQRWGCAAVFFLLRSLTSFWPIYSPPRKTAFVRSHISFCSVSALPTRYARRSLLFARRGKRSWPSLKEQMAS